MNKIVFILFSIAFLSTPISSLAIPADISVCFTPGGNCAEQIINQINKELSSLKKLKLFKENLIELRRFEDSKFFQIGLQTIFLSAQETNSADLIAKFIADELSKTKKHNFFLRFLKKALVLAKGNLPQAIKIKITGRFNRARRSRHKFIFIGGDVPTLTIKNNINYSDQTTFTPNGTFGVKVWVYTPSNK